MLYSVLYLVFSTTIILANKHIITETNFNCPIAVSSLGSLFGWAGEGAFPTFQAPFRGIVGMLKCQGQKGGSGHGVKVPDCSFCRLVVVQGSPRHGPAAHLRHQCLSGCFSDNGCLS